MTKKVADAVIDVLHEWGIQQIFGLPGDTINATVDALERAQEKVRFIQVRHEEVGALAATAHAKLTGKAGVVLATGGPGALHLLNGLYDAKMDHVPVLALIGQVTSDERNEDYFQEINTSQLMADVAVFNRTITTGDNLPEIVDQALRVAHEEKGVAVLTIPGDLPEEKWQGKVTTTAAKCQLGVRQPEAKSLQTALDYINRAKKPVAFIGTGARSAATEIREFLEKQSMPFVATLPAKGIIGDKHPNYLGNLGKLGTKPAYEALHEADLILLIGTNYPYVDYLPEDATFIQIDHSAKNIGKRRAVDVAIHADISAVMPALLAQLPARDDDTFLRATQKAVAQWESWLDDKRLADDTPLAPAAVAHLISEYAPADAIFSIDVGTTISWTARFLPVMPTQRYLVSAWLGTMGYALPSAIATSLAAPNRQSYAITGDGGFAMVMQDFLTAVKYHLPVVTVIFNNQQLGFIELEQQGAGQRHFGIDLEDMDYAAFAQSAGGVGYNIRTRDELIAALGASRRIHDRPILLNVYVANDTPIPGKILVDEMKGFATYAARSVAKGEMPDIPPLKEIMRQL